MKYIRSLVLAIPIVLVAFGNFSNANDIASKKGIYYDNFNYTNNVTINEAKGTDIDYNANLSRVGDYYEIVFDVINDTNTDMKITVCIYNEDDSYFDYELTYCNGKKINSGDIIKQGESKQIKYFVQYKNPITEDNYLFDSSFSIEYEQVL